MAQKTFKLDGIGEITIAKRRGTRHIRVTVNASGRVRIGLPAWVPYRAGLEFARSHREWIQQKLAERPNVVLRDGLPIGKAHRLHYLPARGNRLISTRLNGNAIEIRTDQAIDSSPVQKAARLAAERALQKEAEVLLPQRLKSLASLHGFDYRGVRIRKLTSRWGSCSSQKIITLSYLLVQLPWHLIDYVLLHELVHTHQMNHSSRFWDELTAILPNAKELRKEIRQQHPQLVVA